LRPDRSTVPRFGPVWTVIRSGLDILDRTVYGLQKNWDWTVCGPVPDFETVHSLYGPRLAGKDRARP
jgi:hypothetical protein